MSIILYVASCILSCIQCIMLLILCILALIGEILSVFIPRIYMYNVICYCKRNGILLCTHRHSIDLFVTDNYDFANYLMVFDNLSDVATKQPTELCNNICDIVDADTRMVLNNYWQSTTHLSVMNANNLIKTNNATLIATTHKLKHNLGKPPMFNADSSFDELKNETMNIPLIKYILSAEFHQDVWTLYLLGPFAFMWLPYLYYKLHSLQCDLTNVKLLETKLITAYEKHQTELTTWKNDIYTLCKNANIPNVDELWQNCA